jgi:hypothetical protein
MKTEKIIKLIKDRIKTLKLSDPIEIVEDIKRDYELGGEEEKKALTIADNLLLKEEWEETRKELEKESLPEVKEEVKVDPDIIEEAKNIVKSPDIIEKIKSLLECVSAGEIDKKMLILALLLSGKIIDKQAKQIILLKGEAGSGKSTLMEIANFFKTKDIGRFTEHALDYSDLQNYEVLKIKELGSMDLEKEESGLSTLKFISADDLGYTVEYTVRDKETGLMTTQQHRIPPITVITSTIRVNVDPQLERRSWTINPDESVEQTQLIKKFKAKREWAKTQKLFKILKYTPQERAELLLKEIIKNIEPVEPILLFPCNLTKLLKSEKLRVRGDIDKVFWLVKIFAVLNQNNLPIINIDGKKAVVCTPTIAYEAIKTAKKSLITMTSGLEERSRQLIDLLKTMKKEVGSEITKEDREMMAVKLKRSERTIRKYLGEWVVQGFLSEESEGRQHKIKHKLLYPIDEIELSESSFGGGENFVGSPIFPAKTLRNMGLEALNRLSSLEKLMGVDTKKNFTPLPPGSICFEDARARLKEEINHFEVLLNNNIEQYSKKNRTTSPQQKISSESGVILPSKPSKTGATAGQSALPAKLPAPETTEDFAKIEPVVSTCAYCGEKKELEFKDKLGNYMCRACYEEEMKRRGEKCQ